ncbi:MAG: ABC transporter ATP-binding protein/permease [Alphaproteobacteria bacterium]|nr:ABC transporter ATP-binding protein/permease [Alphaproteobacteria bacterium]
MLAMCATHTGHVLVRQASRIARDRELFRVKKRFTLSAYKHMRKLGQSWHNSNHSGKSIHIINAAKGAISTFISKIDAYINIVFSLTFAIVYLYLLNWKMAAVYSIWLMILVAFVHFMNGKLSVLWANLHVKSQKLSSVFQDYVSNMRTILSLRLGLKTQANIEATNEAIYPDFNKSTMVNQRKWSFMVISIIVLGYAMILWHAYDSYRSGNVINIGVLVALKLYLSRAADNFFDFAETYDEMVENGITIRQADVIFKEPHQDISSKKSRGAPNSFNIRSLSFRYGDAKSPAVEINDFEFTAKRGKKIALVGASGSGKSTFMMLIRGILRPNVGAKHISHLDGHSIYIPQDPEFFENTIEYNISVGAKYSHKDVEEAVKISKFDSVMERLPKGLATHLFEKGVNLSGGEKQRLALARGLLAGKDSGIMLFDECTSSVDGLTERTIMDQISKKFKDKILIFSVHKLNLLDSFDEIYVFNKGKIVQRGTFSELQKSNGHFKNIWAKFSKR